jgi:predicted amidohydrolase YtcJ
VVVQNPTHLAIGNLNSDLRGVFEKTQTQPLRSLLATGIPVALGSDGPMNPYLNIMLASVHPNWPSEAITREQAVIAYTSHRHTPSLLKKTRAASNRGSWLT